MDWSLLSCGVNGHVTFAPEPPALRERLSTTTREGSAWRCLRCGTFVVGEPTTGGPVPAAPKVRRGKEIRSAFILRLFAVERFLRAIIFGVLAIAIWRFSSSRMSLEQAYDQALPELRAFLRQLGFNVGHSKLLGLIHHAFTLNSRTLAWLALAAAGYAVIEIIEAVGLWLLKRWGEYFAMIATSAGIPIEIYDLTAKVTVLRLAAFAINVALVVYLVVTKRLFGVRGGKKAYEARLRSASILQTEIDALAAGQEVQAEQEAQAEQETQAGQEAPATPAVPGPHRGQAGQPGTGEAPDQPQRPPVAPAAGATDQPGGTQTTGATDQPGGTQTTGATDQPGGTQTARGPGQPKDAAATSSSAAE
jgi:uncharacterized membrane protein (DUF2068 family)